MENLRGKYVVIIFDVGPEFPHYLGRVQGYMNRQEAIKYCKNNNDEENTYMYLTATQFRNNRLYAAKGV